MFGGPKHLGAAHPGKTQGESWASPLNGRRLILRKTGKGWSRLQTPSLAGRSRAQSQRPRPGTQTLPAQPLEAHTRVSMAGPGPWPSAVAGPAAGPPGLASSDPQALSGPQTVPLPETHFPCPSYLPSFRLKHPLLQEELPGCSVQQRPRPSPLRCISCTPPPLPACSLP